jgi:rhodanese-related sulfurtransferase
MFGLFLFLMSTSLHAETYEKSRHINTDQFAALYGHAIIVDCRSRLEYDVVHIKKAVHIPSGTMVKEDLDHLIQQFPHKPIVFYCNGTG